MVKSAEMLEAERHAEDLNIVILGHMFAVSRGDQPTEAMLLGWASALTIAVVRHYDAVYGPDRKRPYEECEALTKGVANWLLEKVEGEVSDVD